MAQWLWRPPLTAMAMEPPPTAFGSDEDCMRDMVSNDASRWGRIQKKNKGREQQG